MEKQTMGKFIATLRKANGMTQAQLAEKLMVSNRTVSKWETDEGYPDLSIIPVLAEIFDVTADEILKGARITKNNVESIKPDKQIERLIKKNLLSYKYSMLLAILMNVIGWLLFSIPFILSANGFTRPFFSATIVAYTGVIFFNILGVSLMFFFSSRAKYAISSFDRGEEKDKRILKAEKTIGDLQFVITSIAILCFVGYWGFELAEYSDFFYLLTNTAFTAPLRVFMITLITFNVWLFLYILKVNFQVTKYFTFKENVNKNKILIRHIIFLTIIFLFLVWSIFGNTFFLLQAVLLYILVGLYLLNIRAMLEKYYIRKI